MLVVPPLISVTGEEFVLMSSLYWRERERGKRGGGRRCEKDKEIVEVQQQVQGVRL